MILAEQGNRVKQITESEIQHYVEKGWTITDGRGTVLKESVPADLPTLRLAYVEHENEIKQLKAQIATLELQIEQSKAPKAARTSANAKAKAEPVPTEVQEEVAEVTEEVPEVIEETPAEAKATKPNRSKKSK